MAQIQPDMTAHRQTSSKKKNHMGQRKQKTEQMDILRLFKME